MASEEVFSDIIAQSAAHGAVQHPAVAYAPRTERLTPQQVVEIGRYAGQNGSERLRQLLSPESHKPFVQAVWRILSGAIRRIAACTTS